MKENIIIILVISIFAILLGYESNWLIFLGEGGLPDKLEGLIVTVIFLVALLVYGIYMGYMKRIGFMKFNSFYWGIGCLIPLIAHFMKPIGKFVIIVIPADILFLVPTLGLGYFYNADFNSYLVPIVSLISSWSAGAIGYLLGSLLKKLRVIFSK